MAETQQKDWKKIEQGDKDEKIERKDNQRTGPGYPTDIQQEFQKERTEKTVQRESKKKKIQVNLHKKFQIQRDLYKTSMMDKKVPTS